MTGKKYIYMLHTDTAMSSKQMGHLATKKKVCETIDSTLYIT